MNDEKLEQAKGLQEKMQTVYRRIDKLTEKSFLEGHALEDCTFKKISFTNRQNNVDINIKSNNSPGYCGEISESGKDQLNTLITVFRNSIATVYQNELKKLEQEYAAL